MRFHLPKGIRGWREFTKEIAVIVIGVLIALGLEQVVEELHWRNEVRQGEDTLRDESMINYAYSVEQVIVSPCILAQIDTLIGLVQNSGRRLSPVPTTGSPQSGIRRVLTMPWRDLQYQQWQALQQDGTVTHIDRKRQRMLSGHYTSLQKTDDLRENINELRNRLDVLGVPIELDPQVKAKLLDMLHQTKGDVAMVRILSRQSIVQIRNLGLAPTYEQIEPLIASSANTGTISLCKAKGFPLADWRNEVAAESRRFKALATPPVGK